MKNRRMPACLPIVLAALLPSAGYGQGPLNPLGPPTPMMKSLDQLEPRTPISSLPYTIDMAGSYYLTRNLIGTTGMPGIVINASDVTVDLNGFSLIGAPGSLDGITVSNNHTYNITVRNGTIRDWDGTGVEADNAENSQFMDLKVFTNAASGLRVGNRSLVENCVVGKNMGTYGLQAGSGCVVRKCVSEHNSEGFDLGTGTIASDCTAFQNTLRGFDVGTACILTQCAAYDNDSYGIEADTDVVIENCAVSANRIAGIVFDSGGVVRGTTVSANTGNGIWARGKSIVTQCTAYNNATNGIVGEDGAQITGCAVNNNGGDGILVEYDCLVRDNSCEDNGDVVDGDGIHSTGVRNRIEGNSVTMNQHGYGINVASYGDIVIHNTAAQNSTNYYINGSSRYGALDSDTAGVITNMNPWINFEF
jgi:hypothetical protein